MTDSKQYSHDYHMITNSADQRGTILVSKDQSEGHACRLSHCQKVKEISLKTRIEFAQRTEILSLFKGRKVDHYSYNLMQGSPYKSLYVYEFIKEP